MSTPETADVSGRSSVAARSRRLARWQERSEWPLAAAAVVFLVAYAWPILQPDLPTSWRRTFYSLDAIVYLAFVLDYVVRLSLTPQRMRYFLRHLLDLAVILLPLLRPLRLLQLLVLLRSLNRRAANSLRGKIAVYVGAASALLIFTASLAVLDAERSAPAGNIKSFGDALWWSATTVTTVGYGDHYPVTVTGRFVAVGLMLGGVALLGVVTASIASWLIDRVQEVETASRAATQSDIQDLAAQIRDLRRELDAARNGDAP